MPDTRRKHTPYQREEYLTRLASLLVQRVPQIEIAKRLGVSHQLISADAKIIRARWREDYTAKHDELVARLLAEIDEVRRHAWAQWLRSCEDAVTTTLKSTSGATDGSPKRETTKRTEGRAGDPRYLAEIVRCNAEERKILGVDAPTRVQVEVPEHEWTDDEMQRLAADMTKRYGVTLSPRPAQAAASKAAVSVAAKPSAARPSATKQSARKTSGKKAPAKKTKSAPKPRRKAAK